MRLLLLHPPLLSAVVWRRLRPVLEEAGHVVVAPELRPVGEQGWGERAAATATSAAPAADAVLAHSGAGPLAALVLPRLPCAQAVILLDTPLPPRTGPWRPSPAVRSAVRDLATDGVLPPWTSWWGDDELATLVPDAGDRALLVASAPRLAEAFYDIPLPVPQGWEPALCGYLQLSPAYTADAEQAAVRGWRVRRLAGRHLDLLSRPHAVAAAVLDLLVAGDDVAGEPLALA